MLTAPGLTKVYPGPVTALDGIDLDVPPGMCGLLRPHGACKSTFMEILAGLLEPTSGTAPWTTSTGDGKTKNPRARAGGTDPGAHRWQRCHRPQGRTSVIFCVCVRPPASSCDQ